MLKIIVAAASDQRNTIYIYIFVFRTIRGTLKFMHCTHTTEKLMGKQVYNKIDSCMFIE